MNMFDPITHARPMDGKKFWKLHEVLDVLGVKRQMHRELYPDRAHQYMRDNGIEARKLFRDLDEWLMTLDGLFAVVASMLPVYGSIEMIKEAKLSFGLLPPENSMIPVARMVPPNLEVIHNLTPVPVPPPAPAPNALSVFSYLGKDVRMVVKDGEPWWVVRDVCDILGIDKYRDALARLDEDERGSVLVDTPGGQQEMGATNEPGLYSLILRSRKEEAKAFKRWITHEVIPTIRKTGGYSVQAAPVLPHDYKSALTALIAEVEKTEALQSQVKALAPRAEFADAIEGTRGSVTVGEFAKAASILGVDGKPLGVQKIFALMRELQIVFKRSDTHFPYQNHIQAGRLDVRESTRPNRDGDEVPCFTTVVTGKGQVWLREKLVSYIEEQKQKAA